MATPSVHARLRDEDLWFDETQTPQIGCSICPERSLCGGLGVSAPILDCFALCGCARGGRCTGLCPRSPREYVIHVRQIAGFTLNNVPRVPTISFGEGHEFAPIVFDSFRRTVPMPMPLAAIPLMSLMNRESQLVRFLSSLTMRRNFLLSAETKLIVTGVADDREIEAWWRFRERHQLIAQLRELGVSFATAPNYSLATDVTRHDNFHSMKRIALTWAEFVDAGIPCALHLNARTPTDYRRWRDFVGARPEVTAVAFEFLTGAKGRRGAYHRDELIALAEEVRRPMTLIVRGGTRHLPELARAFPSVWVLDSNAHMKTKNCQKATFDETGRLTWATSPVARNSALDELFRHNVCAMRRQHLLRLSS